VKLNIIQVLNISEVVHTSFTFIKSFLLSIIAPYTKPTCQACYEIHVTLTSLWNIPRWHG